MRSLVALALVLVACGPADRRDPSARHDAPSASTATGPDPIVLRIPRDGGLVRAYLYPRLDSVIWMSGARAAAPARVLAFDQEAGSVAYVDRAGLPGRIDLRDGTVAPATRAKLRALSSADGWAIYGIAANGNVTRLTPTGDWTFEPPRRAQLVLPQSDGSLLVVLDDGAELELLRLYPPDEQVVDTAALRGDDATLHAQAGDRVYFGLDSALVAVYRRSLDVVPGVRFAGPIRAVAPTPSGDRVFVAIDSSAEVAIVDRYSGAVARTLPLPGVVRALRMDPLGRFVLARPAAGDSAWVIAVGSARVVGSVRTAWRDDIPFVAPDGAIAVTSGDDVTFVSGSTLAPQRSVAKGAADYWHVIAWNGFRPRSAELDQPVTFADPDSAADSTALVVDSASGATAADSTVVASDTRAPSPAPGSRPAPARTGVARPSQDSAPRAAQRSQGWVVSFFALLSESRARELAGAITVNGETARVSPSQAGGTTIYRVVLGPYASKADAERVGRESRKSFWVFESNP